MKKNKVGYSNRVGQDRAVSSRPEQDIDQDPSVMIQEQVARIKFLAEKIDFQGASVLDVGCGTGFNSEYAIRKLGAKRALGVDISESAIEFARKTYNSQQYIAGDVCDPDLDMGLESWDIVLCCEVFEHVPSPISLLDTIKRHLSKDGIAFISTPNKPVFSLGSEPSPVVTHLKEFCIEEYAEMLEDKFSQVEIWGQQFKSEKLLQMRNVGVRREISDLKLLGNLYRNLYIRRMWKVLRLEPIRRWLERAYRRYNHLDFEFVKPISDSSIWLCAIVKK